MIEPVPLRLHRGNGKAAAQERAVEIGGMNRSPIRQAGVLGIVRTGRSLEPGDPGIVHQHVADRHGLRQRCPVRFFAHIKRYESGTDRGSGGCAASGIEIGEDDSGPFALEGGRNGAANAACRAGDDAGLTRKSGHGDFLEQVNGSAEPSGPAIWLVVVPPQRCRLFTSGLQELRRSYREPAAKANLPRRDRDHGAISRATPYTCSQAE